MGANAAWGGHVECRAIRLRCGTMRRAAARARSWRQGLPGRVAELITQYRASTAARRSRSLTAAAGAVATAELPGIARNCARPRVFQPAKVISSVSIA
jgi:hypothetical protein